MARPLPDKIAGNGFELRRMRPGDEHVLGRAVAESMDHLRPWMPWIANEPTSPEQRRMLLSSWAHGWPQSGEAVYGIFVDGTLAGVVGLRPRTRDTLEIGYWIHVGYTRRGLAASASRALTDLAFSWADVHAVEIHHDRANTASGGVPRKLGYTFVGERRDPKLAPAEVGIDCTWRADRQDWAAES